MFGVCLWHRLPQQTRGKATMSQSQSQRACEEACRDAPWPQGADAVRAARGGAWEDGCNLCAAV
jgi:hypothetical protein